MLSYIGICYSVVLNYAYGLLGRLLGCWFVILLLM
jgi:hypothetical protein